MKWKTHLSIAKWVGKALGFSQSESLDLAKGAIAPDRWSDQASHHNSRYLDRKIKEKVLEARKLFLQNKKKRFFALGVALHYIEDRLIQTDYYPAHIQIEEELAKLSTQEKKHISHKHSDEIKKAIMDLAINEEEKNYLLNPTWVKGKSEVLTLALIDLPAMENKLLFNIACRIAIGIATGITSTDSPPELLCEKVYYFTNLVNSAKTKFKVYLILALCLPLLFLWYRQYGFFIYIAIILINLSSIKSIISILRQREVLKSYLQLTENSKSLAIVFILATAASLLTCLLGRQAPYFLPAGIFLLLITVFYLCYPKITIDADTKNKLDWYKWEQIA